MRFRRNRAESSAEPTSDASSTDSESTDSENAVGVDDKPQDADLDPDDADDVEPDNVDLDDDDDVDSDEDDVDDEGEPEDDEREDDEPEDDEPKGRFAWLKPRKKEIDYGDDFEVHVATLPDLERFPEDGHVPPEIVRSWMALQQFGEAMLLVSWLNRAPVGYVLVSWTGDWDDDVRREYPDVPALCNLWADERYVADDVEAKLIEAAIKVCTKQGRKSLLATIESTNTKVRGELEDLGFEKTGVTTSEKFVYRDAEGRKRRGSHENVVLLKSL